MEEKISIIIVYFSGLEDLLICVGSIIKNLYGISYHIYLVNNNPKQKIDNYFSDFKEVSIITNTKNLGYAKATNIGVNYSSGDYVLVLNPDTVILGDAIQKMKSFLDDNKRVGVVFPKLLNKDGSLQYSCRTFPSLKTVVLRRSFLGGIYPFKKVVDRHLMRDFNHNEIMEINWALGACFLVRRESLESNKIFDGRYFLYFEDVDFCLSLWERGYKVVYYPKAEIIHNYGRESANRVFNLRTIEHVKSYVKFSLKNIGHNKSYKK